jgi:hypothetical protein
MTKPGGIKRHQKRLIKTKIITKEYILILTATWVQLRGSQCSLATDNRKITTGTAIRVYHAVWQHIIQRR